MDACNERIGVILGDRGQVDICRFQPAPPVSRPPGDLFPPRYRKLYIRL